MGGTDLKQEVGERDETGEVRRTINNLLFACCCFSFAGVADKNHNNGQRGAV